FVRLAMDLAVTPAAAPDPNRLLPSPVPEHDPFSRLLLAAMLAFRNGDFAARMPADLTGVDGKIADVFNEIAVLSERRNLETARVSRAVGTEGKLGGRAEVPDVAGVWKDLTDNVNSMAANLTNQVRNIAEVTTAVARGDLSRKITVDVKGEILELKDTINTMLDQLNSFA